MVGRRLGPRAAEDVEGVGARTAGAVVGRTHYECRALGEGAELADYQPVAELGVVEQRVVALEARGVGVVIVVSVVAYLYVRGVDYVFHKARSAVFVGEYHVWVGYV